MIRRTCTTLSARSRNCAGIPGADQPGAFLSSRLEQSFVFHRLVILGEAAVALAKTFQGKYPEVPWPRLISLRNRLVHAYFDLDVPPLSVPMRTALCAGMATR